MAAHKTSFSIFHRLLLALLVVSLVPLVLLWAVGSAQVRNDVAANISHRLLSTSASISNAIVNWDDTNVRVLRSAAAIEDIRSMVPERQKPILHAFGANYEWAFVIYTVAPNGDNIARSDTNPLVTFGDRNYFKSAMTGAPISRQVVISRSTKKPVLALAVPIRNDGGEPVGVLAMAMKLDDVAMVIKDTQVGQTGYALLLDTEKKLIATGVPGQTGKVVKDMSGHPALSVAGIDAAPTVYRRPDGKRVVAFVNKLPQGWVLIVEQDYDEAYASLEALNTGALMLIALTAFCVLIFAFMLGKALTRAGHDTPTA